MEAFLGAYDTTEKSFLLLRWYNLVLPVFGEALVLGEITAENVNKFGKWQMLMLV